MERSLGRWTTVPFGTGYLCGNVGIPGEASWKEFAPELDDHRHNSARLESTGSDSGAACELTPHLIVNSRGGNE